MNLMHLKYAAEVARAGSINKAAENLYMAQPNLSRAIKELEASLGITIFERNSKGMSPTPSGEEFLRYANKILHEVDEVEKLYRNGDTHKQRFSISVPRASYIANAFAEFSKHIDNTKPSEIFYKETNSMRAVKNILESDYHLGIVRYAALHEKYFKNMLEEKGLRYEMVTKFTYQLIMSRHHPLAEKKSIVYHDLVNYTEIAHADPFVPSLPMAIVRREELPSDVDKRIFVFERASQFELLAKNHNTYMWVSPVPQDMADRFDLVQRPCTDNTKEYRDILIYQNSYRLSELDRVFIEELFRAKREFLGDASDR